jgi:hypothetical protein
VDPRHRDGLLAAGGLAVLLAGLAATDALGAVFDPTAAVAGVAGAVLLEVAFLRYPGRLLSFWERRGVPVAGLLAVLLTGVVAARDAPGAVGALAWGLATYLALLAPVLAGLGNPLGFAATTGDGSGE